MSTFSAAVGNNAGPRSGQLQPWYLMPSLNHPAPVLRLDLQGLRAVAVTVVFFSHAGVVGFSGGYVGVDLFFVLSGFLITGALYKEYECHSRLDVVAFYSRRLKRLLPAMVFMIAVTLVVSFILLPSFQAQSQIGSAPFASLWLSNFYFTFTELDYFNELGKNDLFLHTWSLGVEEQFYLIWPLLFLFLARFAQQQLSKKCDVSLRLMVGLCLVFFLSLTLSNYWAEGSPLLAFYQMPSRAWQFALGALVFFLVHRAENQQNLPGYPVTSFFALTIGVAAITICVYMYSDRMSYPGWAALIPSFGAALIILAGSRIPEKRNPLAQKPFVWLGNRSYSLYLWHWPVLLLIEAVNGVLTVELVVVGIAISLVLTEVSYRLVERPFWKGSLSYFEPRKTIQFGVLVMFLALLGSFHAVRQPVVNGLAKNEYISQQSRYDYPIIYAMACDAWYANDKVEPCVFGPEDAQKTVVLLGDSIGTQWFALLELSYLQQDWRLVVLTKSACPMVDHSYFYDRIKQVFSVCDSWRDKVLDRMSEWEPDVVVVGSASGYSFSDDEWVSGSRRVWERIQSTGARVLVLPGTPTLAMDAPSCISREIKNRKTDVAQACSSDESADVAYRVSALLEEAASEMPRVDVLDLNSWVCPSQTCSAMTEEGVVIFRDSKHLTNGFVISIAPQIAPQLMTASKEDSYPSL